MTNSHVLERPKTRAQIMAYVVEGKSDPEIARLVSKPSRTVTRQAVCAFRKRHAAEIEPVVAQVEAAIIDVALKDKEARIRELAWLYGLARTEAEEHGINITEIRYEGEDGETKVETHNFRAGMVKEMRGLLGDIASELGDRNAGKGDVSITVDNRRVVVYQNGIDE